MGPNLFILFVGGHSIAGHNHVLQATNEEGLWSMLPQEGLGMADARRHPGCCVEVVRHAKFIGFRVPFVNGKFLQVSRRTKKLVAVADHFGVYEQMAIIHSAAHKSGLLHLALQPRQLTGCVIHLLVSNLERGTSENAGASILNVNSSPQTKGGANSPGVDHQSPTHCSDAVLDLSLQLTRGFARRVTSHKAHGILQAWLAVTRAAQQRALAAQIQRTRTLAVHCFTRWLRYVEVARAYTALVYVAANAVQRWAHRRQLSAFVSWRQITQLKREQRMFEHRAIMRMAALKLKMLLLKWCDTVLPSIP